LKRRRKSIASRFSQPEEGAAKKEAADLVAAVVEDQAAPIRMEALLPRGVFVQVGTVEVTEAVLVAWEV
jgi:hypothetical protein